MEDNQPFTKLSLFELLELRAVERETERKRQLDNYLSSLQTFDTTVSEFVSYKFLHFLYENFTSPKTRSTLNVDVI